MPSPLVKDKAEEEELKVFNDGIRPREIGGLGLLTKDQMEKILRDNRIWEERDQGELDSIRSKILLNINKLKSAKNNKEFYKYYDEIKVLRVKEAELSSKYDYYLNRTVDARAHQARLMYLISSCIYDENNNKIWKSYEEFKNEEDLEKLNLITEAAKQALCLFYGIDVDLLGQPEDKILKEREDKQRKEKEQLKKSKDKSEKPAVIKQ